MDNDVIWSRTYLQLLNIDTRLKDIGNSLALLFAPQMVCVTNLTYSKESVEIHSTRNKDTFKRKEYFLDKMTAEVCADLVVTISELRLVEFDGEESFCDDFFAQREVADEQDAQETAAAVAILRRVADERTAEDALLQEEKRRQTIVDREYAEKENRKKEKERLKARVLRNFERELDKFRKKPTNAVVVAAHSTTSAAAITNPTSSHSGTIAPRRPRPTVSKPKKSDAPRIQITVSAAEDEMVDSDGNPHNEGVEEEEEENVRPFIAPDRPVRMRRNEAGQKEEDTSDEDDDELSPHGSKRQRVFEAPFMNSELHQYLMESGRRQVQEAAERMNEADVSEGAVDQAIASLQDLINPVLEPALEMDINGRMILHRIYDKLNFKNVLSNTSAMSRSDRNRAVDIAFCEVVVNDVCDTVMKNVYRDQNSAVYWYLKRMANNVEGDDVAVIEKHQWQLFWIEVKEKAMERYIFYL